MRTYTRPFTIARLLLVLALMLLALLASATPAHAATRNVCPSGCTYSQIQPAIDAASNGDTINIGAGTYYGGLDIYGKKVTLAGAGAGLTIIEGVHLGYPNNTDGRAVLVNYGATVQIQGVTIRTNYPDSDQPRNGGILNAGTLTVIDSAIDKNRAPFGGGIANQGTLAVINSVISRNFADQVGGGILNYENSTVTIINSTISGNYNLGTYGGGIDNNGTLTVTNSTITGNNSLLRGGGINNSGTATVANSTISGNTANDFTSSRTTTSGGGIYNFGTLNLTNNTISDNWAQVSGGIENHPSGVVTMSNTILAKNTSTSAFPDCRGILTDGSGGHNLLGDGSYCTGPKDGVNGDQVGTTFSPIDPKLEGLTDNSGPTQTMALLRGSPAIGAGDVTTCQSLVGSNGDHDTDQRGRTRDSAARGACSIGAYDAAPIHVCPSGCAYSQIQPALDAAVRGDIISLAAGMYNGGLSISKNVTLAGAGPAIIQGGDSVVTIDSGATVRIEGVTITGGVASYYGGGIENRGTLTLDSSTVSGNSTNPRISYSGGGGIENVGSLTVINSTISDNFAQIGGGIHTGFGAPMTIVNSTISGNRAYYSVGGILSNNNVTVSGSIIAKNTASAAPDCSGSLKDGPGGHNLLGDNSSCSGLTDGVNGNRVGTAANPIDPKLGSLADNGGPTQTMALLPGSPAISAGDATTCQSLVGSNGDHDTDQRGQPRNSASRGTCDIGAYDTGVNPPPNLPPTTSASTTPASPNGTNGWFTTNVTVNLSATDDDDSGVKSITYSASGAQPIAATTVNAASASLTISTEGTTTISYYATDNAGNVETARTFTIKLDKTAPSITASATKADGTAYTAGSWTNQNVTVSFSCSDATSDVGPGACPASLTISAEGTTNPVSSSVSDQAGNSVSASFGPILIDKTAPTITFANRSAPNAAGWNNSAVTVNWTCGDALSGAAAANVSQALSSEGANQSATGTCTDKAGNSASNTQSGINIDTTAPSGVGGAPTTNPNASGWYNAPVTVMFSGTDTASGIAGCTSASYSGPDSVSASVSGSCTDQAGNTSAAVVSSSFKYDATAPTLAPSVSPNPVLLNGSATASANAGDATSGIASQSCGAVSTSSIGTKSISCSATDKAGNSASANASYSVIYNFSGFFLPVSNPPTLNQANAGKSVVLTFSLAGNQGLNILATNFPASRPIDCSTLAPLASYQATNSASKGGLQYNAKTNQYTYSWTTDKVWAGTCQQFDLKLIDGTEHLANFKFTK